MWPALLGSEVPVAGHNAYAQAFEITLPIPAGIERGISP